MIKYKKTIFIILGVIVFSALVTSVTYAYIVTMTNQGNVHTNTGTLDVDYTISENITGELLPSSSKDDGLKATATAKITSNSIPAAFNLYINPEVLDGLAVDALKWEVYGYIGNNLSYSNTGNFSNASVGNAIKIVNGYELTTDITTFNIYIWIDGSLMTESVIGKRFKANITPDSVPITGEF